MALSGVVLDLNDILGKSETQLFFLGLIGFLGFPILILLVEKSISAIQLKLKIKAFRKQFLSDYRGAKHIPVDELVERYKITLEEVDRTFEYFIKHDLLRGVFEREHGIRVFTVPSDFEILPLKERPLYNLNQKLPRYLAAYKNIPLENIATTFNTTIEQVEIVINNLIDDGYIDGAIKNGLYIRDPIELSEFINNKDLKD